MVRAIYNISGHSIKILPPSINRSDTSFTAEESTNSILFGLGGISGINNEIAQEIISLRPFRDFNEFLYKITHKNTTLLTPSKIVKLIKAGCFDECNKDRISIMKEYIYTLVPQKKSLTLKNFDMLRTMTNGDVLPSAKTVMAAYYLRQYTLCSKQYYKQDGKFKTKKHYIVPSPYDIMITEGVYDLKENKDWYFNEDGEVVVIDKSLDKALKPDLEIIKKKINQPDIIDLYNDTMFQLEYQKRVKTNDINKWSFEATSFYHYDEHELKGIDYEKYNLNKYTELPEEPSFIERQWGKRTWHQYDLSKICGTVVDRNDNKHMIYLLTPELTVVVVKFYAGQYAYYKRIISTETEIIDSSWFNRGELLMISGYRQNDIFKAKRYQNSIYQHTVARITQVLPDGSLELQLEKKEIDNDVNEF